jgi:antitoxin (DNA-binding transcriptional repressor) of toxin-antitoxin stability system
VIIGMHDGGRKGDAMIQVTMDEAKERLPDLIDAAARGEMVLIEKDAGHAAQIVQLVLSH